MQKVKNPPNLLKKWKKKESKGIKKKRKGKNKKELPALDPKNSLRKKKRNF